jgi:hypothetical protein
MPRPADECLAASSDLIAKTRSKLAELQFSLDTCLTRIEVSAGAIAASQALLAKLDTGARLGAEGAGTEIEEPPGSQQTSDGSPSCDGAASLV